MSSIQEKVDRAFAEAEKRGLELAITGRSLALVLLGLFFVLTRSPDLSHALDFALLFGAYLALGGVQYSLLKSRYDQPWMKFVFILIDLLIFAALIATQPIFPDIDMPQHLTFGNTVFPFFFVFLAVVALTFSTRLMIWVGVAGSLVWISAFLWVVNEMPVHYDWRDMGTAPSADHFYDIYFSPYFAPVGSRIQESIALLVAAILLAVVMQRARRLVRTQIEAAEQQNLVTEMFGRFVPEQIVNNMMQEDGRLDPVEADATVLFVDIAQFTNMTERLGAARLMDVLNAWFDGATQIISDEGGVVTQFQGDAIVALFNTPFPMKNYQQHAVNAALQLTELARSRDFADEHISIRVGLATGQIVAGNVGGGGRQTYTAHGNTVNLAARLEAMNKEKGTTVLMDENTANACDLPTIIENGTVQVRGLATPMRIFTFGAAEDLT